MTRILAAYLRQSTIIISKVYNRLFINQCVFCLTHSQRNICVQCQEALPHLGQHCPQCAEPNHHGHVCGECLQHPPAFDRVICPFIFKGPVAGLIQKFKRSSKVLGLECIEHTLSEQLHTYEFDAIVCVPYHWKKLLWRGHNPTGILASSLSKTLSTPLWQGLVRTKATGSQQGLDKNRRRSNVRRAFSCTPSLALQIKGKNLLLIDDVLTTGATCHAAALVLKKHGAKSVTLACLARTPLEH
ncbi:MAG: ComF family protein [Oceanicoccus sp.]